MYRAWMTHVDLPPARIVLAVALLLALGCGGDPAAREGDGGGRDGSLADARAPSIDAPSAPSEGGPIDAAPIDAAPVGRDVLPFDGGGRVPSPRLADLPDNTALDLGPYDCMSRGFTEDMRCELITDYSRLDYDPAMHRVLMFGGGHAATGRTDVDVLDLETLTWSSLYPSMTCEEVMAQDLDPRGFHRATGHPVARHTYDQNVVAIVGGAARLVMMSTEGFAGYCHRYDVAIRSVAWLPLAPGVTTWEHSEEFSLPWAYAACAEFDPVSGMILMLGSTAGAGEGGMWVIDPATGRSTTYVDAVAYPPTIDSNLVYYPPTDTMYAIESSTPAIVWRMALDRADWSGTTNAPITTTGTAPGGTRGYAYDQRNQVIGGALVDDTFHVFDPATATWSAERVEVMSDAGATPGTSMFHVLDYDPVDNVYIFLADGPMGRRTRAYRYRR
jgi:hypothetical protein